MGGAGRDDGHYRFSKSNANTDANSHAYSDT